MFLNEKAYQAVAKSRNVDQQTEFEKVCAEVQRDFEAENVKSNKKTTRASRKKFSEAQIKMLTSGEEIEDAIENATDPQYIESSLSGFQLDILRDYRQSTMESIHAKMRTEIEKRMQALKSKSKVEGSFLPLLRLRVADLLSSQPTTGTLTFWKPSEELQGILIEGKRLKLTNVGVGYPRDNEVQLKATKTTQIEPIQTDKPSDFQRNIIPIHDIVESVDFEPMFNEVDTVGVFVKMGEEGKPFQSVYFCDTMLNFVSVHFWKSLDEYGYGSLFNNRSVNDSSDILYLRNLQWRMSSK